MAKVHAVRCVVTLDYRGVLMLEGVTVWAKGRRPPNAAPGPRHDVQLIAGRDSPRSIYQPGETIVLERVISIEEDEDPTGWEWHAITIPGGLAVTIRGRGEGIKIEDMGLEVNQGLVRLYN